MKTIIAFLFAAVTLAGNADFIAQQREVPPDSDLGKIRAKRLKQTGGFIAKPNTQKGKFLILDAQDVVASSNFTMIASQLSKATGINFAYEKTASASVAACDWNEQAKKRDAKCVIAVVADDKLPMALVAPEDNWGVVNTRKLSRNLLTDGAKAKFLEGRTRREFGRVFALLCGGVTTGFKGVAVEAATIEEADSRSELFPPDVLQRCTQRLIAMGYVPERRSSYRKACQEGWAPQPTNDLQKAIWDEIHTLPSDSIKIKFDPKRDK